VGQADEQNQAIKAEGDESQVQKENRRYQYGGGAEAHSKHFLVLVFFPSNVNTQPQGEGFTGL
jgi:hypothetical protein